jgi:hypothetical protein
LRNAAAMLAWVLRGDEAGGGAVELVAGQRDQPGVEHEHHDAHPCQAPGQAAIALAEPVEPGVEAAEEASDGAEEQRATLGGVRRVRLEQQRA